MIDSLVNSTASPLLVKMAAFAEKRHEVLAGNIANIDTPGYKMRDLPLEDFQSALAEAVKLRQQPAITSTQGAPGLSTAQLGSVANPTLESIFRPELFQAKTAESRNVLFHDDNNRSIEHQIMEMTKTAMMQRFAIEVMGAQGQMLHAVLQERP